MARLKLMEAPVRTLEVERPDGRVVILELNRFTVTEADKFLTSVKLLEVEYKKGNLTPWEFISKQLDVIVKNYKPDDFSDLEYYHIIAILNECKNLIEQKPTEEKKSQE